MKITPLPLILSLGLSVIVAIGEAAPAPKASLTSPPPLALHRSSPKGRSKHHQQKPEAIPSVPYIGHDHMQPSNPDPALPAVAPEQPRVQTPDIPAAAPVAPQPAVSKEPPLSQQAAGTKKIVAYWTDWTAGAMPPEAIPFDKVTHINYAFSVLRPDFTPVFETDYLLNRVVRACHARGVKVLMSIGGWTGSQYFSPLSSTPAGRKTFIDGAIRFVKNYDLDGIDIDWEYPGRAGSACNIYNEMNDAHNFLTLLRELRTALNAMPNGQNLEISLATRIVPFDGPDGQMRDVSDFAKVVNHINIMAYDINGSWSPMTGANAPFSGQAGALSFAGGAQAWIDAGFPPEQINMGVPFYGRSLVAKYDMTHGASMSAPFETKVPVGDNNDGLWTDPCERTTAFSGVWKYRNLRAQGIIDRGGRAIAPWVRTFDNDSHTPWLFNPQTKQFISYDDMESLRIKIDYVKQKNLGGMMLWAINQDTADFELLSTLQEVRR